MKVYGGKKGERGQRYFHNGTQTMRIYEDVNDGSLILWSYATMVIKVDREGWLHCSGLYSQTTARHIRTFLANFAPDLLWESLIDSIIYGYAVNIHSNKYSDKH
jgi:hypothetical protein